MKTQTHETKASKMSIKGKFFFNIPKSKKITIIHTCKPADIYMNIIFDSTAITPVKNR